MSFADPLESNLEPENPNSNMDLFSLLTTGTRHFVESSFSNKLKRRDQSVLTNSKSSEKFPGSERSESFGRNPRTNKDILNLLSSGNRWSVGLTFSNKLKKYNPPADTTNKSPIPNTKIPKIKGFRELKLLDLEITHEITQMKEPPSPKKIEAKERSG